MTHRYLADTSAIARLQQRKAAARWTRAVDAGVVALCDPVELGVLRWVPGAGRRRADLRDRLGDRSKHNGAAVVELLVAVTAAHHRLTVLHDDRDYEANTRVTGLPTQRVID